MQFYSCVLEDRGASLPGQCLMGLAIWRWRAILADEEGLLSLLQLAGNGLVGDVFFF